MSAKNWASVLKKFLHKCFLVTFAGTLRFLLVSRLQSVWRRDSWCEKVWKTREVEGVLCQGQRALPAMPLNTTLSVLKTWQVWRVLSVVIWWQPGNVFCSTNVVFLTHQLTYHHTRHDHFDWLHAQPFWKYCQEVTVFPENMIRNINSTFGLIFSQRAMLTLIEKGMTRVNKPTTWCNQKQPTPWDSQVDFKPLLEADPSDIASLKRRSMKSSTCILHKR